MPALPQPELQYSDYTLWQRSLHKEALEPLLFLEMAVAWDPRCPRAAIRAPARNGNAFTEARHTFTWDAELGNAIRAFAAGEQIGPATVTLAAFKSLLHRYTRQDEIVIGGTEPCRRQPSAARLVGPVDNLVVLRTGCAATCRSALLQPLSSARSRRHAIIRKCHSSCSCVHSILRFNGLCHSMCSLTMTMCRCRRSISTGAASHASWTRISAMEGMA